MTDLSPYIPIPPVKIKHPQWSRDAAIYQINTRQFTDEGTFAAAERHLPRLRQLGVAILWLMPIHKIGAVNRKGSLGSPYAVQDYYSVNPEFGDLDDFKRFVAAAHAHGFHVILDWVANHTAWDSNLVGEHPEWYIRDYKGDFRPTPWWDWPDIIELDYEQPALRKYMTDALKYWVVETDIDGFRCDVAGFVPGDFWSQARKELDAIKPVFMLAEWEARDLHETAFDMTYAWSWYDAVHNVTMGKADLSSLFVYYSWNEKAHPADIMRMLFVSNHDKNAWEGTEFENFGAGLEAAIVLSVVSEGMPLIYNGQEAGSARRLAFFDRDPITWQEHPLGDLYKRLLALKKQNSVLWNGKWGARMVRVFNNAPMQVLSFVRRNEQDKVFAVINFSPVEQRVDFEETLFHGHYTEFFSQEQHAFPSAGPLVLAPWESKIFVQ